MFDYRFDEAVQMIQINNDIYADNANKQDNQNIAYNQSTENCEFRICSP
jgi:hypothetical protein